MADCPFGVLKSPAVYQWPNRARTFVVLGSRWDLGKAQLGNIFEVPPLQANLAFSEAYLAGAAVSRAGFVQPAFERLYVNDQLWFILSPSKPTLTDDECLNLDKLGASNQIFPANVSPDSIPIPIRHLPSAAKALTTAAAT